MKRIQNRIAESRYALPATAVVAVAVCVGAGLLSRQLWSQFGCLALTTYLMVLMNNQHALMRIYSRMVSCSFLALSLAANFLFADTGSGVVAVAMTAFYTILFHAYQDKSATGTVFYAFLCVGIASTVQVQILWLVPLYWVLTANKVLAMSTHTLLASLLGLVAPYWFWACYLAYANELPSLGAHFAPLVQWEATAQWGTIPLPVIITTALIATTGIVGAAHFVHTSFNDKIRTRMIYEFFTIAEAVLAVAIVLQPQLYRLFIPLLIVNTAPLCAHFAALSHTRVSNIVFLALMVLTAAITVYNLVVC